jgi:site-specific DNA-methyltransferase (adenine-specific)
MTTIDIRHGDFLVREKDILDNSIDLIVTSPPYNAKQFYTNYNDNQEFTMYYAWLKAVCKGMYRIIKPNSSIFINICDIGISNGEASGIHKIGNRGNFYVEPTHIVIIGEMISLGAQYLHPIFWKKPSNHNSQFGANARFCGTYPYPKNCHVPSEIEYILHFRKNGIYKKVDRDKKLKSKVSKERWLQLSSQVWEFNGVQRKDHPAPFPLELPLRCIEGWSFIEDLVLDPFVGIGTTALACKKLNRNFIGFDISDEYCRIARQSIE